MRVMAPLARLSASFSSLDATSDCCPLAAMMTLAASSRPPSPAPFGRSSALFPPSPSSPSRPSSRAEHRRSTIDSRTPSPAKTLVRPSGLVVPSSASTTTSLLPSFAQGRFLPPPHPTLARESTDPRCHSSPSLSWASLRSSLPSASNGVALGATRSSAARAPSPARGPANGPAPSPKPPVPQQQQQLRRSSSPGPLKLQQQHWNGPPARDPSRQSALPPPRTDNGAGLRPARPPSPVRTARSFHPSHSSSSLSSSSSSHAHPSLRPASLIVTAPKHSLRRSHSKVELDSPGPESIPPSPTATAHFSPAERHRTVRSNQQGYRSLVRRASLTTFDLRVHDEDDDDDEARCAEVLTPISPPPPPTATHRPSLQRRGSSNGDTKAHAHIRAPAFPPTDPRIPSQRRLSTTPDDTSGGGSGGKRTIFNPYELSVLQALWHAGHYYPAPSTIDEVQRRTGMTRTQVRNWCVWTSLVPPTFLPIPSLTRTVVAHAQVRQQAAAGDG